MRAVWRRDRHGMNCGKMPVVQKLRVQDMIPTSPKIWSLSDWLSSKNSMPCWRPSGGKQRKGHRAIHGAPQLDLKARFRRKKRITTIPIIAVLPFFCITAQNTIITTATGKQSRKQLQRSRLQREKHKQRESPDGQNDVRLRCPFHKIEIRGSIKSNHIKSLYVANVRPMPIQPWMEVKYSSVQERYGMARSFLRMTGSEGAEPRLHVRRLCHSLVPVWRTPLHGRTDRGECRPREAAAA